MSNLLRPRRDGRGLIPILVTGAALVLGTALVPAFADDWPELRGNSFRRGVSEEKIVPPLSLLWRFSAGAQANNPCAPAIVGDTVYYAARARSGGGGNVFALDVQTGAKKWQYPTDDSGLLNGALFQTAPLVADGKVYIGASDGYMYELNARTGQLILRYRTIRPIASAATLYNEGLYFGSNDGTFYALDPKTGNYLWNQRYQVRDGINSAPIISDGLIFFTTNDNTLHAVRQATGLPRWSNRLPGRIPANGPIYAQNNLVVPAGRNLVSVLPSSGNIRWSRTMPDDIVVPAIASENAIYTFVRSPRGPGVLLYVVNSGNGRDLWEKPVAIPITPSAAPTLVGDILYVPTNRNKILALSRTDGSVIWSYYVSPSANQPRPGDTTHSGGGFQGGFSGGGSEGRSGGFQGNQNQAPQREEVVLTTPISVANGTIYAVADDGSLMAFRSDAPDATGPEFTNLYPPPGRAINGQPPVTLAANISDLGTGVDSSKLTVKLDDTPVDAKFDVARNLMIYLTRSTGKIVDPPLSDGRHTVSVTAVDYRGNKTEQSWSFTVNNALPPPAPREAPQAPRPTTLGGGDNNNPNASSGRRRGGRRGGNNGNPGGNPGNNSGADTPPPATP